MKTPSSRHVASPLLAIVTIASSADLLHAQNGTWTSGAPMSNGRFTFSAASDGRRILVFGGHRTPSSLVPVCEAYDPASKTWSKIVSMPTTRRDTAAARVGGLIYVVGGNPGAVSSANETYDPRTNTWTRKANMPTGRRSPGFRSR